MEAGFRRDDFKLTHYPKMKDSALSLTILNRNPDAKLCLEVGAAILLDKPLIVVLPAADIPVSANLRRCASMIVEATDMKDPATMRKIHDAISSVLENDSRARTPQT